MQLHTISLIFHIDTTVTNTFTLNVINLDTKDKIDKGYIIIKYDFLMTVRTKRKPGLVNK